MNRLCSMFSQLLKLFPRTEFQALVRRTHAERHARGFTCWGLSRLDRGAGGQRALRSRRARSASSSPFWASP